MRCLFAALSLAVILAAASGNVALAKAAPTVFHTSDQVSPPAPGVSFLGGCGHGRYRDRSSHVCRGPADISR